MCDETGDRCKTICFAAGPDENLGCAAVLTVRTYFAKPGCQKPVQYCSAKACDIKLEPGCDLCHMELPTSVQSLPRCE